MKTIAALLAAVVAYLDTPSTQLQSVMVAELERAAGFTTSSRDREHEMQKVMAKAEAGSPPETVRTLAQWADWKRGEDQRMAEEIRAQLEA